MAEAVETAKRLARKFEGLRLKSYLCPAGVVTIGYGATGPDVRFGMVVSPEWAEARLEADVLRFLRGTLVVCPSLAVRPKSLAAIGDFALNLGLGALRGSTLRRRVNDERWGEAVLELRKWVNGGGRKLPGLVLRREAEAALL